MKNLILTILFLFSTIAIGQVKEKLTGKPSTLEETFKYLNQMFDDTLKYSFMTLPEDISTIRLHHGLGTWIRNNWGLWGNSKLKKYLSHKGAKHPDNMSGIILTSYHRYLNNKPIDLKEQIKSCDRFYNSVETKGDTIKYSQEFINNLTTDSMLLSYFPVGDTIVVSIYASYKKWFTTYSSSVRAIAIVQEHRNDKLLIKIIKMEIDPKKKPERRLGDIFEIRPRDCNLIPHKDWALNKHR